MVELLLAVATKFHHWSSGRNLYSPGRPLSALQIQMMAIQSTAKPKALPVQVVLVSCPPKLLQRGYHPRLMSVIQVVIEGQPQQTVAHVLRNRTVAILSTESTPHS